MNKLPTDKTESFEKTKRGYHKFHDDIQLLRHFRILQTTSNKHTDVRYTRNMEL